MIFFNDEGTENGGLIFAGSKRNGVVSSGGHLSFDQYEQDQVLTLDQIEEASSRTAGLGIYDRPDQALDAAGTFGEPRLFIGKADGNSVLALRDAKGRKRLVLKVAPAGDASIQFLDETGKVVRMVTPQS
jgi:hypothetical protein